MQQSSQDSWHRREVPLEIAADSSNPASMRDYGERGLERALQAQVPLTCGVPAKATHLQLSKAVAVCS